MPTAAQLQEQRQRRTGACGLARGGSRPGRRRWVWQSNRLHTSCGDNRCLETPTPVGDGCCFAALGAMLHGADMLLAHAAAPDSRASYISDNSAAGAHAPLLLPAHAHRPISALRWKFLSTFGRTLAGAATATAAAACAPGALGCSALPEGQRCTAGGRPASLAALEPLERVCAKIYCGGAGQGHAAAAGRRPRSRLGSGAAGAGSGVRVRLRC